MTPTALLLLHPTIADVDGSRQVASVLIDQGRIVSVGEPPPEQPADLQTLDCSGLVLAPGLFDAHVHLALTPSGAHIQPTPEQELTLWKHHLAAYLANGVTSVLDTGITLENAQRLVALAETTPSPDIHLLGPLVSPEGGYVSVVLPDYPGYTTAEQVDSAIAAFAPLEPMGVKVTVESGMVADGPTTQRELELLTRAGLDPDDLMRAATLHPAQMLGMHSPRQWVELAVGSIGG